MIFAIYQHKSAIGIHVSPLKSNLLIISEAKREILKKKNHQTALVTYLKTYFEGDCCHLHWLT